MHIVRGSCQYFKKSKTEEQIKALRNSTLPRGYMCPLQRQLPKSGCKAFAIGSGGHWLLSQEQAV